MHRSGMSIQAIAQELGLSRGTVREYLREPGTEPAYRARASRPSKLDPFKGYLLKRIAEAAPRRLPAPVYLRDTRELGYGGWFFSQHQRTGGHAQSAHHPARLSGNSAAAPSISGAVALPAPRRASRFRAGWNAESGQWPQAGCPRSFAFQISIFAIPPAAYPASATQAALDSQAAPRLGDFRKCGG